MIDPIERLKSILADPYEFLARLFIKNKQGRRVRFKLSAQQRKAVQLFLTGKNLVILKARQLGITTLMTALLFWKALSSPDPISCVSLLHKRDAADEVFLKYKGFYYGLPALIKPSLDKETSSLFRFDTGSSVAAVSAAGHAGLRSYTVNLLHLSELCFYDDPAEILSNALSALNGNQLVVESTATAYGDPMHELVDSIQRGSLPGNWELVFFPWYEQEEYSSPAPTGFVPDAVGAALIEKLGLTIDQLWWRHCKIAEQGLDKFNTEYPATIEDVFSQKGDCYYSDPDLSNMKRIPAIAKERYIEQPIKGINYAIGVDVASGIGKDYSSIFVLSQKTGDPVYVYRSNLISPTELAKLIAHISALYGRAKTLVESNNWGHTVINELEHLGFNNFYKVNGKHWETTSSSKVQMHEQLKEAIRRTYIGVLDEITLTELKGLVVTNSSRAPESQRTASGHGDNVIALGLAYQCLLTLPKPSAPLSVWELNQLRNKSNPYNSTWRS